MHSGILVLLSSFLLFLIQPILGKSLLPHWGGTSHVWTTCLLFFQSALLAGYLYASQSCRKLSLQNQAKLHSFLWILSAVCVPALIWWPSLALSLSNLPTLAILLELTLRIGLPLVLLSSTGSLISAWHHQTTRSDYPYAFYALANLTSLAACLVYPIAIEPWISSPLQQKLWMALYWSLALGMVVFSRSIQRKTLPATEAPGSSNEPISMESLMVIGLSACTSIVLSATTTHASQAGVIVPGLWVMPLAVYLATWWIAFSIKFFQSWAANLGLFYCGAFLGLSVVVLKLWLPWTALIACSLGCIACIGLACHGLIYRLRPSPDSMPSFYLLIALGGALGSLFASIIAPWCFSDYYELHAGLALGAILISWFHARSMSQKLLEDPFTRRIAWPLTILSPTLLLGAMSMLLATPSIETLLARKRDFYGVVSVIENQKQGLRAMLHGRIRHGTQPIVGPLDPDQTTYYQTDSGAALAFGWCHELFTAPLHVAVIGLGTGSLSLYAKASDSMRYFEISPAVCELAKEHFGYLDTHSGKTDIRVGDGRQLLQLESLDKDSPKYQLIVVDAFSNDSLPIHLLTAQALETYRDRLDPDGILALNITNRNLDLAPVLFATCKSVGLKPLLVESKLAPYEPDSRQVRWLLLFPSNAQLPAWPGSREKLAPSQDEVVWTDQFASPLHALRW